MDHRDLKDHRELQAPLDLPESRVAEVFRERTVFRVSLEPQVYPVYQDLTVLLDLPDH